MSFVDKFTKKEIIEFVNASKSLSEVLKQMGYSGKPGATRTLLLQYVKENNINTEHFTYKVKSYSDDEVFSENSQVSQHAVRNRYKKCESVDYKCAVCGLEPIWNNQRLTN